MEYVFYGVKFEDKDGAAIDVEEYSSFNTRTGKVLSVEKSFDTIEGGYLVASDSHGNDISKKGDIILVSGKHPVTKDVKTGEFRFSSGDCHIEKISGPTVIVFD